MSNTTRAAFSAKYVRERSRKIGLDSALSEIERAVIKNAIKDHGRYDRAADELRVNRTTLIAKRRRLGLLK
jgi:transcriptional regulator with PAS, ATPase and Fis domain